MSNEKETLLRILSDFREMEGRARDGHKQAVETDNPIQASYFEGKLSTLEAVIARVQLEIQRP